MDEVAIKQHSSLKCVFIIYFSGTAEVGFVHSLTPIKKGRNGKDYYSFELQNSPTKLIRSVGFNKETHDKAKHYQTTGTPVKLVNINQKDDQIFINAKSLFTDANADEINFKRIESLNDNQSTSSNNIYQSIDIKLKDLKTLITKQKVNVEVVLTLGDEKPKQVTKRDGKPGYVKEDCIVEDDSGSASIHIWETSIAECECSKSYKINNLAVKNFSGNIFLATTTDTAFFKSDLQLDEVKGRCLLSNAEKEIVVGEFKMVDKVSRFLVCQAKNCQKCIPTPSIGCKFLKCEACGVSQKVKFAELGMSGRLCAEIDGEDVWLSAYTDVMGSLLAKAKLSQNAKVDEIVSSLLNLENINLKFNVKSNYILKIL